MNWHLWMCADWKWLVTSSMCIFQSQFSMSAASYYICTTTCWRLHATHPRKPGKTITISIALERALSPSYQLLKRISYHSYDSSSISSFFFKGQLPLTSFFSRHETGHSQTNSSEWQWDNNVNSFWPFSWAFYERNLLRDAVYGSTEPISTEQINYITTKQFLFLSLLLIVPLQLISLAIADTYVLLWQCIHFP